MVCSKVYQNCRGLGLQASLPLYWPSLMLDSSRDLDKQPMPCTALHCTALHCTALHCTALHHISRQVFTESPPELGSGCAQPSVGRREEPVAAFSREASSQESGARSQEPRAGSQEPGSRRPGALWQGAGRRPEKVR